MYIFTVARIALWFLAVTHVSSIMPHGENKEYKACSRWIFLNLWRNRNSRIINHVHKATFVLARGTNVYSESNLSNFLQKEGPTGSETWTKKERRMMLFDFPGQKVLLRPKLEGTPGLLALAGIIFWIPTLAASILSTCGSKADTEWQSYDRFSEYWSIMWQSLKEFHFLVTLFAEPPRNCVSSMLEILYPCIYWPLPGMPFGSWLSHMEVTTCHMAKTRSIRLVATGFSWIYEEIGIPGS